MPMNEALSPAPPRDFESLRAMIITRRQSLPKRLAQVAAHTLDNPDEIAFGTAASIAAAADVQPSTLVRFAQHFGFEGFSDLQRIFRDRLKERTSSYEERLTALRAGAGAGSHEGAILDGFLDAARRSLDRLSHGLDAPKLERAVAILAGARTIHLIARRRSYPISTYMAYAFGKLGIPCTLIGSPVGIDAETLALAGEGDAAVAISFSPYASETADHARALAARGVPVVAITDSAFSPLAGCATEWFEVAEADFAGFRSLSATMALAMALTVSVAERRADAGLRKE
jgi:DNA-binding MurR/RpiR family transcriptional regulator